MKTTVYTRVALLALALAAGSPTAFAQTAPAPASKFAASTTGPTLTSDEKAHLEKVRTEALTANPDLKIEAGNLKAQHQALKAQGTAASDDSKQALKMQKKEYEQKLQTAMLKIDPTVAPILAKLKAAHKEKKAAANA